MREQLHVVGGKLVGVGEAELGDAVLVAAQEGLPRYGVREVLADGDVGGVIFV